MMARRVNVWVFALLFAALVAFLTATFDFRSITDSDLNSLQTRALALHGDANIARYDPHPQALWVDWRGGKYSIYGVGVSLPAVPLYAVMARMGVSERSLQAAATIPFVAAAVLVLYHVMLRLFSRGNATIGALLFVFGTTMWPVASMAFYMNASTALFQAVGLWGFFSRSERGPVLAGLGFGLATMVRPISAIPLVFVGIFLLVSERRKVVGFGLGALLPLVVVLVQNRWIWGGWLTGGYSHNIAGYRGDIPHALWALTFGWWRGLFVYSPFFLVGFAGLFAAWRRRKGFVESRMLVLGAVTVLTIVLYAKFTTWHAGLNQFGYRYLLDVVPFLILMTVFALERWPRIRVWFAPLAILSVLTMIFGSEPNRFAWDVNFFATRFVDTPIGQAWTVAVNYPLGNLARTAGVGAVGWLFVVASRTLAPADVRVDPGPSG